jgi:hypothetical protein
MINCICFILTYMLLMMPFLIAWSFIRQWFVKDDDDSDTVYVQRKGPTPSAPASALTDRLLETPVRFL